MRTAQFEDDWSTVLWDKIDYLASLGLTPWYAGVCSGGIPCRTCSIVPSSPYPQNCSDCTICGEVEWQQQQPPGVRAIVNATEAALFGIIAGTDGAYSDTQVLLDPIVVRDCSAIRTRGWRTPAVSTTAISCVLGAGRCRATMRRETDVPICREPRVLPQPIGFRSRPGQSLPALSLQSSPRYGRVQLRLTHGISGLRRHKPSADRSFACSAPRPARRAQ